MGSNCRTDPTHRARLGRGSVELDEHGQSRRQRIEAEGWNVMRFSNEDVEAVAKTLKVDLAFRGSNP